jgi:TRAP-type C4-dicarboxylate transport system permease small subunit
VGLFAWAVERLDRALISIAAVAAFLMMAQVCVDVFVRFVLGRQIQATIEIVSAYYMVALVFLPLAYVERNDSHIAADVVVQLLSSRTRLVLRRLVDVIVLIAMGVLCYCSLIEAVNRTIEGELVRSGDTLLPIWISRWLLPIGSGAMVLTILVRLIAPSQQTPQDTAQVSSST